MSSISNLCPIHMTSPFTSVLQPIVLNCSARNEHWNREGEYQCYRQPFIPLHQQYNISISNLPKSFQFDDSFHQVVKQIGILIIYSVAAENIKQKNIKALYKFIPGSGNSFFHHNTQSYYDFLIESLTLTHQILQSYFLMLIVAVQLVSLNILKNNSQTLKSSISQASKINTLQVDFQFILQICQKWIKNHNLFPHKLNIHQFMTITNIFNTALFEFIKFAPISILRIFQSEPILGALIIPKTLEIQVSKQNWQFFALILCDISYVHNQIKKQMCDNKKNRSSIGDEDYVIYTQTNRRRRVSKKNVASGAWTLKENEIYLGFLQSQQKLFENQFVRRSSKVFRKMSSLLKRRDPEQCRSHHQKLGIRFNGNIQMIIEHLKRKTSKKSEKQSQEEEYEIQKKTTNSKKSQNKTSTPGSCDQLQSIDLFKMKNPEAGHFEITLRLDAVQSW